MKSVKSDSKPSTTEEKVTIKVVTDQPDTPTVFV